MKLIKHFDFVNTTELNRDDWNIEVGEKWANKELQQYVDSTENLFFDNGLVIKATKDGDIIKSARINTKNKFYFKYGKIDIIAKLPSGKGTWPALWMLPQENKYGGWPKSGEIDIMEHVGNEPNKVYLCLHTEAYNHKVKEYYFNTYREKKVVDVFHKYSIQWQKDGIIYYIDDEIVAQYKPGQQGRDTSPKGWPFDEYFYLIINLAIGGTLGGKVDFDCFPQYFIVKDIKIYKTQ